MQLLKSEPLNYLIALKRYGTFSIAAQKLHVTQPALSIAIKNLESELGLILVDRKYHATKLTEEGEQVVALAEKAFSYFDEIEKMAYNQQSNMRLTVTVYSSLILNTSIMSSIINDFYQNYPNGNFELKDLGSYSPEYILTEFPQTFVLTILDENYNAPSNISIYPIDTSPSYIIMHQDAVFLPRNKNQVTFKEMVDLPLIITDICENQTVHKILLKKIEQFGKPNIKFRSTNTEMTTSLIQDKFGISFHLAFKRARLPYDKVPRILPIKNAPKFHLAFLYNKGIKTDTQKIFFNIFAE